MIDNLRQYYFVDFLTCLSFFDYCCFSDKSLQRKCNNNDFDHDDAKGLLGIQKALAQRIEEDFLLVRDFSPEAFEMRNSVPENMDDVILVNKHAPLLFMNFNHIAQISNLSHQTICPKKIA